MKRNLVIGVITAVLIILSCTQIIADFIAEKNLYGKSSETIKQADYCIFIEIEDKKLYLLQNGKCIKKYPVATGKSGSPSPIGFWKIVNKGDWGEGFGGRWLGLNVPWGKYGIHGTLFQESIGSSASHGCIRMYNMHVRELYSIVPVGTQVVIVNGYLGPFGKGFKVLEPGDRGADVLAVQIRLKELGFFKGWESGIYDDSLKHAVHSFQKNNGLEAKNAITKDNYLKMGFREFE